MNTLECSPDFTRVHIDVENFVPPVLYSKDFSIVGKKILVPETPRVVVI